MDYKERMHKVLESQKNLIKDYDTLVKDFDSSDIINDNISLKEETLNLNKSLQELQIRHNKISKENSQLRIALKEQILDEKNNILKISQKKIETYFENKEAQFNNDLFALRNHAMSRLAELDKIARKELGEESIDIQSEIKALETRLQQQINERKQKFSSTNRQTTEELNNASSRITDKDIDEETIKKRIHQNNVEIKFGLNWLNKIGVFIVLIGVATLLKYSYTNIFNDYMRSAFAFFIGILFLGGGEFFSRKEKSIFATGLTGGGIGILYYSVFISHFSLNIMFVNTAMIFAVVITIAALALSLYYNTRTICSFALIGGFLPFFTYVFTSDLSGSAIYIAMGYLFLLNLLTLTLSFYKKWDIINFISFLLNVPTLVFLVFKCSNEHVGILYSLSTFGMYLVITLAYPLKYKIALKLLDIILLGINTFVSCLIIFVLFKNAGYENLQGVLALAFCLIYFGLGKFIGKMAKGADKSEILFYLTAITFAILIVPFQFGVKWLSIGWLIEGILLIIYGYRYGIKNYQIAGWSIFGLCLSSFYFYDAPMRLMGNDPGPFGTKGLSLFDFKFLCVLSGLISTTFMYLKALEKNMFMKHNNLGAAIKALKYFTIFNAWCMVIYSSVKFYNRIILNGNSFSKMYNYHDFYRIVLVIVMVLLFTYGLSKIKILSDKMVNGFIITNNIIINIICIGLTCSNRLFFDGTSYHEYLAIFILLAYNIWTFLNVKDILLNIFKKEKSNYQAFPVVLSIYLIGIVTAILLVQFNLGKINLLFSLLYIAAAFGMIGFGFIKDNPYMRRFGLGLTVFSTGKLFIYDLFFLETAGKIISYFAFGLIMIGISYLYQRFNKYIQSLRVEEKGD